MKIKDAKDRRKRNKRNQITNEDETIKSQIESKSTFICYVNKFWNNAKGLLSNNTSYMYLSAGVLITAYIFYQLGYSFIYGIYFGTENKSIHMMDLFINQIPFDFKFVSIVGIVVFLTTCFYYYPIHMFVLSKKLKTKLIWALLSLITIITICFSYDLLLGMSTDNSAMNEIAGMLILSTATIVMMATLMKFVFVGKHLDTLVFLCYSLIFIGIMSFLGELFKFDPTIQVVSYTSLISLLLIIFAGLADYIIFLNSTEKKNRIFKIILAWIPVITASGLFCWYTTTSYRYIFISGSALFILFFKLIKVKMKPSIYNTTIEKSTNESDDSGWKNLQKYITTFVLLFCSLIPIILYLFIGNTLYIMGCAFGEKESLNSYCRIEYGKTFSDNQYKNIDGVIVAQNNNQYYISTKKRELILIASPYVKISPIN